MLMPGVWQEGPTAEQTVVMSVVYADLSISADGYSTGYNQREEAPFGDGADDTVLHSWMFDHGERHRDELDAILAAKAYIMGRNMFGPVRGEWDRRRGADGGATTRRTIAPVFVLTHHPRDPVPMEGGTTFHFVTDGIEAALARARAVGGRRRTCPIAGGADTVQQFVAAGLLDILRLHIVPATVGFSGRADIVRVFDGVPPRSFEVADVRSTPEVTHITYDLR